jgi:hypothetical protein
MNVQAIDAEIHDLTGRIAELRRQRGAAVLAGDEFDATELNRLQERLEAITDARGDAAAAAETEARETHRRAVADRRKALLAKAREGEARRLTEIDKGETAARELGRSLAAAHAAGDAVAAALSELHGLERPDDVGRHPFQVPTALAAPNREATAGMRISMALAEETGLRHIGGLDLGRNIPSPKDQPVGSWRDQERVAMAHALSGIGIKL